MKWPLQEIMKLTNETYGKDWKSQTVSTYIAKAGEKGLSKDEARAGAMPHMRS